MAVGGDGVGVDFVNFFDGIGTEDAEVVGLHSFDSGGFAEVLDALVVHGHQFIDVGVALLGSLGSVDHGFHDGGAALVNRFAEPRAVFQDLTPRFVAVGVAFLLVEFLVE